MVDAPAWPAVPLGPLWAKMDRYALLNYHAKHPVRYLVYYLAELHGLLQG